MFVDFDVRKHRLEVFDAPDVVLVPMGEDRCRYRGGLVALSVQCLVHARYPCLFTLRRVDEDTLWTLAE